MISPNLLKSMTTMPREAKLEFALLLILDEVDYTKGACAATEMVGAVLKETNIEIAREALKKND